MSIVNIILWFVIVPLIVTYLGNYTYPKLESFVKNRNLSSRERKIKSLIQEYKIMKSYQQDATLLALVAIRGVGFGLAAAVMGLSILIATTPFLVLVGLDTSLYSKVPMPFDMMYQIMPNQIYSIFILLFAAALLIFESIFIFYKYVIHSIDKRLDFSAYREKTIAKLNKIGVDHEEIRKIDMEFEKVKGF